MENPVHTYTRPGNYNVTLTITDDEGLTSMTSRAITVADVTSSEFDLPIPLWVVAVVTMLVLTFSLLSIYVWKRQHKTEQGSS